MLPPTMLLRLGAGLLLLGATLKQTSAYGQQQAHNASSSDALDHVFGRRKVHRQSPWAAAASSTDCQQLSHCFIESLSHCMTLAALLARQAIE